MQTGNPAKPAVVSAIAVLAAGALLLTLHEVGPSAQHMAVHIAAMNAGAPLLAAVIITRLTGPELRPGWLWASALGQAVALWATHIPAIQNAAMAHPAFQVALHIGLFMTALMFWLSVLALSATQPWHAIAALLLSGKLVCLLAALLVFAPRTLYGGHHHAHALDDQQLAGLLMIVACPLSYLIAAIVITARLVGGAGAPRPAQTAG